MITCYPFGFSPRSPLRFVVRASPLGPDRLAESAITAAQGPLSKVRTEVILPQSAVIPERRGPGIRLRSPQCTTPMSVIDQAYRKLLAQIPAEDVKEIEPFD